jgi:hypothetical protein
MPPERRGFARNRMSTVVRQFAGAPLRFPRLSLICASILAFGVARHFLGVRLGDMMDAWDWRSPEARTCSPNAPCSVTWDATAPDIVSPVRREGPQ